MLINKPYSFNNLASAIASVDLDSSSVVIPSFTFNDVEVGVVGKLLPTYDLRHSADEKPWNDLIDIHVEVHSVIVSGDQRMLIYNWEEKEKLAQLVKTLIL